MHAWPQAPCSLYSFLWQLANVYIFFRPVNPLFLGSFSFEVISAACGVFLSFFFPEVLEPLSFGPDPFLFLLSVYELETDLNVDASSSLDFSTLKVLNQQACPECVCSLSLSRSTRESGCNTNEEQL